MFVTTAARAIRFSAKRRVGRFTPPRCSAFYDTSLQEELRQRGIRRLVIAGMQTEYCIDTSCRAARDLGYEVVLVKDGHTTFDSSVLPAERIIAHHNQTLNSGGFVDLVEAAAVAFSDR